MYSEHTGDLFTAKTQAIGHGVNTKGLMGAGIAKAFREKYPVMYQEYRLMCEAELLKVGQIFPFRLTNGNAIINIASQEYPGPDANIMWLSLGMERAMRYCRARKIESLALPQIGCGIGGLDWIDVRKILKSFANTFPDVNLEVWSL